MEQAEPNAVNAGVDHRVNPWLLSAILPPYVKMEFPAPVFGHGFGPPTLNVRQTTSVTHEEEINESVKIKSEPAPSLPGNLTRGTADSASGTEEDAPAARTDSEGGCSRTMAHFSQIWLAKWQQRRQLMKSRDKQQETRDQQVFSPGGPALATSETQGSSVHKALIWPQQQRQSISPVSIPVGVAVSQQRAEGKRSSPVKPDSPIQVDVQPAVPSFTNAQIPYSPPVYSPALFPNWPLWPPDYAGFWSGHGNALGYAGYTVPPQASAAGVIHHHHVSGGGAGPPAASPFLLIPCLDPYQRPAMFWTPTYHHHPTGDFAAPTWTPLPELHPPTPAPTPWPTVSRPFEVPGLIHTDLSAPAAFVAASSSLNTTGDDVKSIKTGSHLNEPALPNEDTEREQVAHEVEEASELSESTDEQRSTDPCVTQTIRVRDNLIDSNEKEVDSSYSGLHLLSDSIERYVSRAQSPAVTDAPPITISSGSALDVLCAAALFGEREALDHARPSSHATTRSISTCSEKELSFRSKLAELQRIYKEKQNILKHLKPKRKDKSEKKKTKKKSGDRKEKHSNKRRKNSSVKDDDKQSNDQVSDVIPKREETAQDDAGRQNKTTICDLISPGRFEFNSSSRPPLCKEESAGLAPKIATSYAAALASAAGCVTSPANVSSPAAPEKKKRKADCPVRNQDTEPAETVVPSKKRKFVQLFRWCNSSSPDSPPLSTENNEAKVNDMKNRPPSKQAANQRHVKPKLKAELKQRQLWLTGDHSSRESNEEELRNDHRKLDCPVEDEMDDSERLERHCLPALQLLQLEDVESMKEEAEPMLTNLTWSTKPESTEQIKPEENQENPHTEKGEVANKENWRLTQDGLRDGLRVLIAEHGMLVAGTVTAICPPDIYGVAVDGERGCRPRILPTEELLNDAVLEVCPVELHQMPPGARVCAYWSHKSRALYPGIVSNVYPALPVTGRSHAKKEDEIDVEFDDGDSGRMPISLIRLLPPDYPVTDRDSNPLLKLESRRTKRCSTDTVASTTSTLALVPKVKQCNDATKTKAKDVKKSGSQKKKCEESKENNSSGEIKKHKKERKKKRKEDSDAVPPASPGLAVEEEKAPSFQAINASVDVTDDGKDGSGANNKTMGLSPQRQLWEWLGPSFKKASKGKGRKEFYKAIHRGDEVIRVGDCAIFLSAGRQDRPYVGRIELLWQSWGGSMTVKVRWFYHPEETCGGHRLTNLKTPGALFESNHIDENDVQTISHCCTVSSIEEYRLMCRGKQDVNRNLDAGDGAAYDHFYLAGFYDPTSGHLSFEPGVLEPLSSADVSR